MCDLVGWRGRDFTKGVFSTCKQELPHPASIETEHRVAQMRISPLGEMVEHHRMKTTSVDAVQVFRALGHPARLRIAEELAHGERCVADLVDLVVLSWSTVSRHLALLRAAGIVRDQKRGNQVFYSLALPCVATFASCLAAAAKGRKGGGAHVLQSNLNRRPR
ncbi:MAG TPA: metalloregulator ArsR/SmtB family transcription factor [Planctomycetota bacterium]